MDFEDELAELFCVPDAIGKRTNDNEAYNFRLDSKLKNKSHPNIWTFKF